jgi:hypothetical protein
VNGDKKWEGRALTMDVLLGLCGSKTLKLSKMRASFAAHRALEEDGAAPPLLSEVK